MATFTSKAKNAVITISKKISAFWGYITTDDNSKVLLGENEDQRLIWNKPTSYRNLTKN